MQLFGIIFILTISTNGFIVQGLPLTENTSREFHEEFETSTLPINSYCTQIHIYENFFSKHSSNEIKIIKNPIDMRNVREMIKQNNKVQRLIIDNKNESVAREALLKMNSEVNDYGSDDNKGLSTTLSLDETPKDGDAVLEVPTKELYPNDDLSTGNEFVYGGVSYKLDEDGIEPEYSADNATDPQISITNSYNLSEISSILYNLEDKESQKKLLSEKQTSQTTRNSSSIDELNEQWSEILPEVEKEINMKNTKIDDELSNQNQTIYTSEENVEQQNEEIVNNQTESNLKSGNNSNEVTEINSEGLPLDENVVTVPEGGIESSSYIDENIIVTKDSVEVQPLVKTLRTGMKNSVKPLFLLENSSIKKLKPLDTFPSKEEKNPLSGNSEGALTIPEKKGEMWNSDISVLEDKELSNSSYDLPLGPKIFTVSGSPFELQNQTIKILRNLSVPSSIKEKIFAVIGNSTGTLFIEKPELIERRNFSESLTLDQSVTENLKLDKEETPEKRNSSLLSLKGLIITRENSSETNEILLESDETIPYVSENEFTLLRDFNYTLSSEAELSTAMTPLDQELTNIEKSTYTSILESLTKAREDSTEVTVTENHSEVFPIEEINNTGNSSEPLVFGEEEIHIVSNSSVIGPTENELITVIRNFSESPHPHEKPTDRILHEITGMGNSSENSILNENEIIESQNSTATVSLIEKISPVGILSLVNGTSNSQEEVYENSATKQFSFSSSIEPVTEPMNNFTEVLPLEDEASTEVGNHSDLFLFNGNEINPNRSSSEDLSISKEMLVGKNYSEVELSSEFPLLSKDSSEVLVSEENDIGKYGKFSEILTFNETELTENSNSLDTTPLELSPALSTKVVFENTGLEMENSTSTIKMDQYSTEFLFHWEEMTTLSEEGSTVTPLSEIHLSESSISGRLVTTTTTSEGSTMGGEEISVMSQTSNIPTLNENLTTSTENLSQSLPTLENSLNTLEESVTKNRFTPNNELSQTTNDKPNETTTPNSDDLKTGSSDFIKEPKRLNSSDNSVPVTLGFTPLKPGTFVYDDFANHTVEQFADTSTFPSMNNFTDTIQDIKDVLPSVHSTFSTSVDKSEGNKILHGAENHEVTTTEGLRTPTYNYNDISFSDVILKITNYKPTESTTTTTAPDDITIASNSIMTAPNDITTDSNDIPIASIDITTDSSAIPTDFNDISTAPNELTIAPNYIKTAPNVIKTAPNVIKTAPNELTTAPNELTTAPNVIKTTPNEVTTAPNELTTAPNVIKTAPNVIKTTPNEVTTAPNELTTAPNVIKTAPSELTTAPNELTTAPNVIKTAPNVIKTTPNEVTTTPKVITTVPNVIKTAPNVIKTTPNAIKTAPNVITTAPTVITTVPNVITTAPTVITTVPNVIKTAPNVITTPAYIKTTPNVITTPAYIKTTPNVITTDSNDIPTDSNDIPTAPNIIKTTPNDITIVTLNSFTIRFPSRKIRPNSPDHKIEGTNSFLLAFPSRKIF